ncbi:unnamed protein product [Blepharisma stoltei]|uniref:Uncharacterized protein n=1 Tax=Blepharisma stoltei TaxID=1481888 RepID=A0AAU9K539_9CILI|nr:unnamed protein product [Blepharisma stoltei]
MSDFRTSPSRRSVSPMVKSKNLKVMTAQNEASHYSDPENDDVLDNDEETKEVAAQLMMIRKRHDRTKEANNKKRQYLEKIRKELEKANSVASIAENDSKNLQGRLEQLKLSLENTRKKHEDEIRDKKTYLHVLDRMKKDKISMEMKANSLQIGLKSAKQILDLETEKYRKMRETKYQSRFLLQDMKEGLMQEKKQKDDRIQQLEKNVKLRQEAALRREERQKRQADIAEAAANDDKDSHEVKLRESLLMHRFWYTVLQRKLDAEMQKAIGVEQAFQKIRAATGLMDVQEIVERFLTREQTYNQLLNAVSEAEIKLDTLRQQNGAARNQLKGLQLEDGGNTRKVYADIDAMEDQLAGSYKEYSNNKEKLNKATRVYDQVLNWGEKIMHTLDIPNSLEIAPGNRISESKNTLHDMLELIYSKLEDLVQPIQERKEESRKAMEIYAHKKTSDLVAEMSTQEALSKIVRVKPEFFNPESEEEAQLFEAEEEPELDKNDLKEESARKKNSTRKHK